MKTIVSIFTVTEALDQSFKFGQLYTSQYQVLTGHLYWTESQSQIVNKTWNPISFKSVDGKIASKVLA